MGLKDGRIKLMNQILSGMKVSFVSYTLCPVLVISVLFHISVYAMVSSIFDKNVFRYITAQWITLSFT